MRELHELKEKLCKELKEYSNKELNTSNLEVIDKLSHAAKNVAKLIDSYDDSDYGYYDPGYRPNRYTRGRGRNAKRDSMGRYSSNDGYSRNSDIASELRELMMDAPDEQTRQEYQRVISKLEMM